jgi:hypothetical protein
MARFTQHEAKKGSQKWIQKIVNDQPEILNSQIRRALNLPEGERIEWLSPLRADAYAEYRDEAFLKLLGVKLGIVSLAEFWPKGGPQWDALGKSSSGKLLLVEAKSHISELLSSLQAKDNDSIRKIKTSLDETKEYLHANATVDWSLYFYQYANRLAHLYLLKKNGLPAYLIHVYFINDAEMNGPTSFLEWQGAIELLNSYIGIRRHKLQDFVADLYIDVRELQ